MCYFDNSSIQINLRGFTPCICFFFQTLIQFIKSISEESIHTVIKSNSHYIVWFCRQPIHRQDLSTPFMARSFEGAELQR